MYSQTLQTLWWSYKSINVSYLMKNCHISLTLHSVGNWGQSSCCDKPMQCNAVNVWRKSSPHTDYLNHFEVTMVHNLDQKCYDKLVVLWLSCDPQDHMKCKTTEIKLAYWRLQTCFLVLTTWYQDLFKRSLSDSQLRHGTYQTSLRSGYR